MGRRSGFWLAGAVMIAIGSLAKGIAAAHTWQPCAGSLLEGSILQGYAYYGHFSDECLARMDSAELVILPRAGEPVSGFVALGFLAAILLAASWLVILPALPVRRWVKFVAALPGLAALAVPASSLVWPATVDGARVLGPELVGVIAEVLLPAAVILLATAGVRGRLLWRVALVGWAATSAGLVHQVIEYTLAMLFSDANWDMPPGTGLGSAAVGVLLALAVLIGWWRDGRPEPLGEAGVAVLLTA